MANPTGWKPSMEPETAARVPDVGAGGATRGIAYEEKLLFERGSAGGRSGVSLPAPSGRPDPRGELPAELLRGEIAELPGAGGARGGAPLHPPLAPGTTASTPASIRSARAP